VTRPNRLFAFLAYLLPLIGSLLVFVFDRKNVFARYHACQALVLALIAIFMPVGWLLTAWLVAWVPLAGAPIGVALFALMGAAYIALFVAWLVGLYNSAMGKLDATPVFGGWGDRVFDRLGAINAPAVVQDILELQ
jgi:uncharacterized membrane protein